MRPTTSGYFVCSSSIVIDANRPRDLCGALSSGVVSGSGSGFARVLVRVGRDVSSAGHQRAALAPKSRAARTDVIDVAMTD